MPSRFGIHIATEGRGDKEKKYPQGQHKHAHLGWDRKDTLEPEPTENQSTVVLLCICKERIYIVKNIDLCTQNALKNADLSSKRTILSN